MNLNEIQKLSQNKLSFTKKKYTVIIGANPSKTARSPILWNYFFEKTNQNIEMIPIDTKKEHVKKILSLLSKDKNFIGGCVTVPLKEVVFKELFKKKSLDKITKKIGAVNCLYRENDRIIGTNTDGEAALKVFQKKFGNIFNKKCLVLGYGGVGKAIAAFFNSKLKTKVLVSNRTGISKKIIKKNNIEFIKWKEITSILPKMNIIINCTSLGFDKNKQTPIDKKKIKLVKDNTYFFDAIYNPLETNFLKLAKLKSKNYINGLEMNKLQAILAIKKVLKNKISLVKVHKVLTNF